MRQAWALQASEGLGRCFSAFQPAGLFTGVITDPTQAGLDLADSAEKGRAQRLLRPCHHQGQLMGEVFGSPPH